MVISHWAIINRQGVTRDGAVLPAGSPASAEELYTRLECSYPKFYKMDKLCKWAWVAAEYLLVGEELLRDTDKNKIAVALGTSHGCIEVDKRYQETLAMPSPALFVYTLPNIMLGEICIRHGFKGEQLCTVADSFDVSEMCFSVSGLFADGNTDACLCGWVDVHMDEPTVYLFWVTRSGKGYKFDAQQLRSLCDR